MLALLEAIPYIFLTLVGICVGSFCNVLIFRIPLGEEFVKTPSHCMSCGHRLKWYELIPIVSYVIQGGKCRNCGAKLSKQYPIVEALNGAMWLVTALLAQGDWAQALLNCALFSALLVVTVIDWRTFEIPNGLNLFILILGVIATVLDWEHWLMHLIGLISISLVFLLLWFLTSGNGIGMGDVKLVGAAGLFLGWQRMLLAVIIGSVGGAIIHLIRMHFGAGKKLAFGPYLSAGIWIAALFGSQIITWYLSLFGL